MRLIMQASNLNFAPAIFNLGVMYMEGKGVAKGMCCPCVTERLAEV